MPEDMPVEFELDSSTCLPSELSSPLREGLPAEALAASNTDASLSRNLSCPAALETLWAKGGGRMQIRTGCHDHASGWAQLRAHRRFRPHPPPRPDACGRFLPLAGGSSAKAMAKSPDPNSPLARFRSQDLPPGRGLQRHARSQSGGMVRFD